MHSIITITVFATVYTSNRYRETRILSNKFLNTQIAIYPALSLYRPKWWWELVANEDIYGGSYDYDCRWCQNNLPPHRKNKKCQNCPSNRKHVAHNRRPRLNKSHMLRPRRENKTKYPFFPVNTWPLIHNKLLFLGTFTNARLTSPTERFESKKHRERVLYTPQLLAVLTDSYRLQMSPRNWLHVD